MGKLVDGPNPQVGIVFQTPVLLMWRTVIKNILLQIEVRKLDKKKYLKKAKELIELVGLQGFENQYPYQLSGGMQQRVSICRALIHDPPLLLMDEPFGALDAMTREQMNLELQHIWLQKKKTVLFITHSLPEAVFLSDKVYILSSRPCHVLETFEIDIPRPRTLNVMGDLKFTDILNQVRKAMDSQSALD
jgi:NitT/TauT family transport system ATP-binding protein